MPSNKRCQAEDSSMVLIIRKNATNFNGGNYWLPNANQKQEWYSSITKRLWSFIPKLHILAGIDNKASLVISNLINVSKI